MPDAIPKTPAAGRAWVQALLAALLLGAGPAAAEKLYTSRNENGNLVFSDKPLGSEVLTVRQVEVAPGPCFSAVKRGKKDDFRIVGINDCFGPVEFRFSLDAAQNMASDRPPRFTAVIPPRESARLVHLRRDDPRRGYRYTLSHSFVIGDPEARHRPRQPYLLPVPAGSSFRISQAFDGAASHTHVQSRYAVDIPMPEGTPVHAARAGMIMEVANDFLAGGTDEGFAERANFIRILHDDGTMGLYAHLKVESIRYPAGTPVKRGQYIAQSGNTGYSSGPHLHFAVQKNAGMELRSIPFRFADRQGRGYVPREHMTVQR